jgi:phage regulator Rha-like protein
LCLPNDLFGVILTPFEFQKKRNFIYTKLEVTIPIAIGSDLQIKLLNMKEVESTVPDEVLLTKIYYIREQKVMLDKDLAELYGVQTKVLKQAVKRNINRFPEDFMFELSDNEEESLRSQIVTSKIGRGGTRYATIAFTEHGVLMLSSILNSERAIGVNIRIMRLFTKMREILMTHKDLLIELEEIRKKLVTQDERIDLVFDYLTQFITTDATEMERRKIGFKSSTET